MNQIVSPAAQVIVSIIPIVGICFAASIIFFALLWKHHENVMLIQKDLYNPPKIDLRNFSLLLGLCLVGVGIVLSLMFLLLKHLSWGLLGGLIPLAGFQSNFLVLVFVYEKNNFFIVGKSCYSKT